MSETRVFEELLFKEINEPVAVHRHPVIDFDADISPSFLWPYREEMIRFTDNPGDDSH